MPTMQFVLDSTYNSLDQERIEEWRAQVRSDKDWMHEHLPASGFSPKAIKHFVQDCCYSKRVAVAEFELMGCKAFGSVEEDSCINVSLFIVTPDASYSGQGVTLYQSGRDGRFEVLHHRMWEELANASEGMREQVCTALEIEEAILRETIWQEQVDKLFGVG